MKSSNFATSEQKKQSSFSDKTNKVTLLITDCLTTKKLLIMKTKNNMVNKMFMNIVTAGTFAFAMTFGFTACSDELDGNAPAAVNDPAQVGDYSKFEPYGLTYHNFEGEHDVQILNADTTEIAVSKKLADKLGITSFVNHPLGIWQGIDQLPYARKAKEERLEGDVYILTVEPTTIAELIGDKVALLNTSIYVNEDAGSALTRAAGNDMPEFAAKYVDESNTIHPAVIHLTDPYGYDKEYHTEDDPLSEAQTRAAASGHYQYMTAEDLASGKTRFSINPNVLSLKNKLNLYHRIELGKESGDTITLSGQCPIDFDLNYFLTLNSELKWKWCIPYPSLQKFESGFDGSLSFAPEAYIGFSKRVNLLGKGNDKKKIFSFGRYSFTFMVGIVPVNIQISPNLYMKFKANVDGGVRLGFKYEYKNEFKVGVKYENDDWGGIKYFKEVKNDFDFIKPEVFFTADAGIGLYLGLDVMLYGVAGPEMGIGPQLDAKASLRIHPEETDLKKKFDFKGSVDLSIQAYVGAKVSFLGYDLGNWSTFLPLAGPWTLKKYPSDGTEHKSPSQLELEDNRSIIKQLLDHIYTTDDELKEACETAIFQEMQMHNVERAEAITFYYDEVLKYHHGEKIDLKNAQSKAAAVKTVRYTNTYINSDYTRFSQQKYWEELDEVMRNSEIYKLYNSQLGYWDKAVTLRLLYRDFIQKYNRNPEMTKEDLSILMDLLLNYSKYFYTSLERNLKGHYDYLSAYANRTATNVSPQIREQAIYETILYYRWKTKNFNLNQSDKVAIEIAYNDILKKLQVIHAQH